MADLKFVDQHNMVACLEKTEENAEFHQIVDFLSTCSINYALTVSPTIYASYIEQFWNTATSKIVNSVSALFWDTASASTSKNKEMEITATIDGRVKTITEASIRRHLKIEDSDGIPTLPNAESFEQLLFMGPKRLLRSSSIIHKATGDYLSSNK
ncbi:hypothetical protein Tco_1327483 [Tanacetum coccineum]